MSIMSPNVPARCQAGTSDQVPEEGRLVVDIGSTTVGIFRFKNVLYAYENVCAHSGGPVCQGRLVHRVVDVLGEGMRVVGGDFDQDDLHIVCPWHGAEFRVSTGAHPSNPQLTLRSFPVEEQGGIIYVTV